MDSSRRKELEDQAVEIMNKLRKIVKNKDLIDAEKLAHILKMFEGEDLIYREEIN